MLLAVEQHNRHANRQILTIACPGFGTGIGRNTVRLRAESK
jgi:hypothetical protein